MDIQFICVFVRQLCLFIWLCVQTCSSNYTTTAPHRELCFSCTAAVSLRRRSAWDHRGPSADASEHPAPEWRSLCRGGQAVAVSRRRLEHPQVRHRTALDQGLWNRKSIFTLLQSFHFRKRKTCFCLHYIHVAIKEMKIVLKNIREEYYLLLIVRY